MSLRVTEQPTAEPVTVAEVKARLRLTTAADDTLIQSHISAAREHAEKAMSRSLAAKSYAQTLDRFPYPGEPISIPRPPLVSVTGVKYLDDNYDWQVWDADEYWVAQNNVPALIVPRHGYIYPCATRAPGSVEIAFQAGAHPDADALEGIRQLAVHLYSHPDTITADGLKEVPFGIMRFFSANKVYVF